ncbi:hypothetical protein [Acidaminobacter sp.]|uniref:hypothetical protein n=1 Tax=Acidaminobacter sp. TaxID=1872102 RepID=UPI00138399FA|nr:hypothetical protein [Acidaminobacter sp.]MDK9710677.1 hypothetical protein [Acidaminobacter sp.]MZQ98116.1 hypothetical protein [Acidaminobacter sp.]
MGQPEKKDNTDMIPFVFSEDQDYDFMGSDNMETPNYLEVSTDTFEKAYDNVMNNLSKIISAQSEKQKEAGFKLDQVKLNLEFGVDVASGKIGIADSAKIEVVLKPIEK